MSSVEKDHLKNTSRRQVFGIPLEDAIAIAKVKENYELPAILFRCIEYLDAKGG